MTAQTVETTERAKTLLRKHDLRITDSRLAMLELLLQDEVARSQPDLEKALGERFDRVTLYRNLTSFVEAGILHRVPDDMGAAKYALCHHDCTSHSHQDEHVHFKCQRCGQTQCLEGLIFPQYTAPKGFTFDETTVLIQGICEECNK